MDELRQLYTAYSTGKFAGLPAETPYTQLLWSGKDTAIDGEEGKLWEYWQQN